MTKTRLKHSMILMRFVLAVAAVIASFAVHAQEETYTWLNVGASIEHSDNIDRIEVGGRDETTIGANTAFEVSTGGRRYDLLLDGLLTYSTFQNDTFDNEFRGNAFGELIFDLTSERLQWVVQDNFGQIRQNVELPETPDNRENLNVFRTGPRLETRFGQRNNLILQGFYQQSHYEDSMQDNEGLLGFIALEREIRDLSTISLNALARRVEFDDDTVYSSYDLQEAYVGWTADGARTRVELEAGYTEIHDGGESQDGNLFRLLIARDVAQRSSLTVDVRSELTTSEDAFRFWQQLQRPELDLPIPTADAEPFRFEFAGLAWVTEGDRLWLDANIYFESREFEFTPANDRDRQGARLALARAVSEGLALGAFAEIGEESFTVGTEDFEDLVLGVNLDFRPSQRLRFVLALMRTERDTDTVNLSFTENLAVLTVSYEVFGDRRRERRQRTLR